MAGQILKVNKSKAAKAYKNCFFVEALKKKLPDLSRIVNIGRHTGIRFRTPISIFSEMSGKQTFQTMSGKQTFQRNVRKP